MDYEILLVIVEWLTIIFIFLYLINLFVFYIIKYFKHNFKITLYNIGSINMSVYVSNIQGLSN